MDPVADETRERLEELVDREEIEGVLSLVTIDQIAEAWCRHTRRALAEERKGDEPEQPNWWAVALLLTRRWWGDEARVRSGLLALVDAADTDLLLECVGAGPFETFLDGDEDQVRWIEDQARGSEKFRNAVASMYVFGICPTKSRFGSSGRLRLHSPVPAAGKAPDRRVVRTVRPFQHRRAVSTFRGVPFVRKAWSWR
jgi:hypothetical protein